MRPTSLRLLLLAVILAATVGAGIFDIAFQDVIPTRPYSHIFILQIPEQVTIDDEMDIRGIEKRRFKGPLVVKSSNLLRAGRTRNIAYKYSLLVTVQGRV